MHIHPLTTLLEAASYHPTHHCDERPQPILINTLIIHNISLPPGEFGTGEVEKFFCGTLNYTKHPYYASLVHLKVSSHLLILRDGKILQFVPFLKRAWHAGLSHFQGKSQCNDFSIGIELEGTDDTPYENSQYQQLADVTLSLMKFYPDITLDRLVGHSDVAQGRKTDPGNAFDWTYYRRLLIHSS